MEGMKWVEWRQLLPGSSLHSLQEWVASCWLWLFGPGHPSFHSLSFLFSRQLKKDKLTLLFSSIKEERPKQLKQRKDLSLRSGMVLRQRASGHNPQIKEERERKQIQLLNQPISLVDELDCLSFNQWRREKKKQTHFIFNEMAGATKQAGNANKINNQFNWIDWLIVVWLACFGCGLTHSFIQSKSNQKQLLIFFCFHSGLAHPPLLCWIPFHSIHTPQRAAKQQLHQLHFFSHSQREKKRVDGLTAAALYVSALSATLINFIFVHSLYSFTNHQFISLCLKVLTYKLTVIILFDSFHSLHEWIKWKKPKRKLIVDWFSLVDGIDEWMKRELLPPSNQ